MVLVQASLCKLQHVILKENSNPSFFFFPRDQYLKEKSRKREDLNAVYNYFMRYREHKARLFSLCIVMR